MYEARQWKTTSQFRLCIFISESESHWTNKCHSPLCLFGFSWEIKIFVSNITFIKQKLLVCMQLVWKLKYVVQEERRTLIFPWMSCSTVHWREAIGWPNPLTPLMKCESHCNRVSRDSGDAREPITTQPILKTNSDAVIYLQLWDHEEVLGRDVWEEARLFFFGPLCGEHADRQL